MTPVQLPEVPKAAHRFEDPEGDQPDILVYTADQLRAYATEAVMADRRLLGARVADLSAWLRSGKSVPADLPFVFRERWQKIVANIRAIEIILTQPEQNSER